MPAGIAAAVSAPAPYAMHATPGSVFENLDDVLGGIARQKFGVVGDPGQTIGFDVAERVGERHIAVTVVMAVGFAICGDVGQLWPVALIVEGGQQTPGEVLPIVEQALKGNGARNGPVVEEQ